METQVNEKSPQGEETVSSFTKDSPLVALPFAGRIVGIFTGSKIGISMSTEATLIKPFASSLNEMGSGPRFVSAMYDPASASI